MHYRIRWRIFRRSMPDQKIINNNMLIRVFVYAFIHLAVQRLNKLTYTHIND